MKNSVKGNLMLLLTASIWGLAFVAQSAGMHYVGPFTFQFIASSIGVLVLLPLIAYRKGKVQYDDSKLLKSGLIVGVIFFAASNFQQVGVCYTTAGKAGFLTAMYILIVPLIESFSGKKLSGRMWLCIAMAVVGLYFLCVNEDFSISIGDLLCLICGLLFALHIMAIDKYGAGVDGVKLSAIQFGVNALLTGIIALAVEKPTLGAIQDAWLPLLYAGAMSRGVAYTLQIIGQKYTDPVIASLIMSLESVFAVIGGFLLLQEYISFKELIGLLLMFGSIILSQLKKE